MNSNNHQKITHRGYFLDSYLSIHYGKSRVTFKYMITMYIPEENIIKTLPVCYNNRWMNSPLYPAFTVIEITEDQVQLGNGQNLHQINEEIKKEIEKIKKKKEEQIEKKRKRKEEKKILQKEERDDWEIARSHWKQRYLNRSYTIKCSNHERTVIDHKKKGICASNTVIKKNYSNFDKNEKKSEILNDGEHVYEYEEEEPDIKPGLYVIPKSIKKTFCDQKFIADLNIAILEFNKIRINGLLLLNWLLQQNNVHFITSTSLKQLLQDIFRPIYSITKIHTRYVNIIKDLGIPFINPSKSSVISHFVGDLIEKLECNLQLNIYKKIEKLQLKEEEIQDLKDPIKAMKLLISKKNFQMKISYIPQFISLRINCLESLIPKGVTGRAHSIVDDWNKEANEIITSGEYVCSPKEMKYTKQWLLDHLDPDLYAKGRLRKGGASKELLILMFNKKFKRTREHNLKREEISQKKIKITDSKPQKEKKKETKKQKQQKKNENDFYYQKKQEQRRKKRKSQHEEAGKKKNYYFFFFQNFDWLIIIIKSTLFF